MKTFLLAVFASITLTGSLFAQATAPHAKDVEEELNKKTLREKSAEAADKVRNAPDKAKDALEKLLGKVGDLSGKAENEGRELWSRSKEILGLTRKDYLKKAASGLATMDAEIQALAESGSAVVSRDYFVPRMQAMRLQLEYCKRDFTRLNEIPDEEGFRVKQRGFNRTLGFLGDNIELAKEEAGL